MPVTTQLVANMEKLPPELAFDILDDLRLWDVLQLVRRDSARVNSYLMGVPRYRSLLGEDPETFTKTCKQVKDYLDFTAQMNIRLRLCADSVQFHSYDLRFDPENEYVRQSEDGWNIIEDLHDRIWFSLRKLCAGAERSVLPYIKDSQPIPSVTIHSTLAEWKKYWDIVTKAKAGLLRTCSDQILQCAKLLEENPDILKRSTDPDQTRRENIQHIVSRMKHTARKLVGRNVRNFRRIEYLSYHFLAVIPFDAALERLLSMMEKHRVTVGDKLLDHHPPAIMSLARIVVDGMPYFYSQHPVRPAEAPHASDANAQTIYPRTENSPWSVDPEDKDEWKQSASPRFTSSTNPPLLKWRRTVRLRECGPHSSLEEGWLVAFVKLYRFLEQLEKNGEF